MQEGLSMRSAAGVDAAREFPVVDALNLVRERNRVAEVVIHAGDTQQNGGNIATFVADDLFGANLRFRVCPRRPDRPVFVDELPRLSRAMDEHRAREDKLFDL